MSLPSVYSVHDVTPPHMPPCTAHAQWARQLKEEHRRLRNSVPPSTSSNSDMAGWLLSPTCQKRKVYDWRKATSGIKFQFSQNYFCFKRSTRNTAKGKTNKQQQQNKTNKQATTIKQQTNKQKTSPFSLFRLPFPLPLLTTNSVHINNLMKLLPPLTLLSTDPIHTNLLRLLFL